MRDGEGKKGSVGSEETSNELRIAGLIVIGRVTLPNRGGRYHLPWPDTIILGASPEKQAERREGRAQKARGLLQQRLLLYAQLVNLRCWVLRFHDFLVGTLPPHLLEITAHKYLRCKLPVTLYISHTSTKTKMLLPHLSFPTSPSRSPSLPNSCSPILLGHIRSLITQASSPPALSPDLASSLSSSCLPYLASPFFFPSRKGLPGCI